jgi:hypothetical protein
MSCKFCITFISQTLRAVIVSVKGTRMAFLKREAKPPTPLHERRVHFRMPSIEEAFPLPNAKIITEEEIVEHVIQRIQEGKREEKK